MVAPNLDLPSSETVRWSPYRIASVVNGDRGGAISTGKLVVNLDTRGVSVDDRQVRLTSKEYNILELLSLRKGTILTKEMLLNYLYGGIVEPEINIIGVFVCKLRQKLAAATGGKHYIETVWGRGYVLRDPAPVPTVTPLAGQVDLGVRHDAVGTTAVDDGRTGRQAYRPTPQTAQPVEQITERLMARRGGVGDNPVTQHPASRIEYDRSSERISSSTGMWFEDAVTKDGGAFHLLRPEAVHSLFGCATARCQE